jgi:hypothetical protein
VLDSPLLAYRAPDSAEDDLSGTDLKQRFYDYLMKLGPDRQVIIVENVDPTSEVSAMPQTVRFTGNQTLAATGFLSQCKTVRGRGFSAPESFRAALVSRPEKLALKL